MSTSLPEQEMGVLVPVSRTVTKYFTCAADFLGGAVAVIYFMDEQTDRTVK